jgi:hypothetical protein
MSIVDHTLWPEIRPYVRIERYDRDGGHAHPRYRIEVYPPDTGRSADWQDAMMPCVACGALMHPIRQRAATNKRGAPRHLFYAATCPLRVRMGCARSGAARDEYLRVRADLERAP